MISSQKNFYLRANFYVLDCPRKWSVQCRYLISHSYNFFVKFEICDCGSVKIRILAYFAQCFKSAISQLSFKELNLKHWKILQATCMKCIRCQAMYFKMKEIFGFNVPSRFQPIWTSSWKVIRKGLSISLKLSTTVG